MIANLFIYFLALPALCEGKQQTDPICMSCRDGYLCSCQGSSMEIDCQKPICSIESVYSCRPRKRGVDESSTLVIYQAENGEVVKVSQNTLTQIVYTYLKFNFLKGHHIATARPFGFLYPTNGDETTTPTVDGTAGANGNGNQGFCFTFQEHSP